MVSPGGSEELGVIPVMRFVFFIRSPVLLSGVFEQFCELQRVFADFLNGCEKETVDGDVNHLLKQTAGFEEVTVFALFHQFGKFNAGTGMIVTILRINREAFLLQREKKVKALTKVFVYFCIVCSN